MRACLRLAFIVTALALVVPAAHAGTVTLKTTENCECDEEGGTDDVNYALVWTGAAGESNTVEVSFARNAFRLADATAPVSAGAGCTQAGDHAASCPAPDKCVGGRGVSCFAVYDVWLRGADGPDVLGVGALPPPQLGTSTTAVELDGGDGDDTLTGSPLDDSLAGGGGRDILHGGAGADTLTGDSPVGLHAGAPLLPDAPAAADTIDGGPGQDAVDYGQRTMPVTVDLAAGTGGELGEGDRLTGVENVFGGSGDDSLAGDEATNFVTGALGSDRLDGRGGADTLDGGPGSDELHGGAGDDELVGDGGGLGGPASPDTLDGGDGSDTADWSGTYRAIRVDLSDPGPDGEPAAPDTLTSIENVTGATRDDVIVGDAGPNVLNGDLGRDRLTGGGGDDTLLGEGRDDMMSGGEGDDFLGGPGRAASCGAGVDRVAEAAARLAGDCESIEFMPETWSARLGRPPLGLLAMANAPARVRGRAVAMKLSCPRTRCTGVLELGTLRHLPRRDLAHARVSVRGAGFSVVRIPLTRAGRRYLARRARADVDVLFRKRIEPLVLRRR